MARPPMFKPAEKQRIVLSVLRGEATVAEAARRNKCSETSIAKWREQFLAGGQAAVKSRPADERDDELGRLRAKVGELTMENELLRERARRAEGDGGPFGRRRSR